MCLSFSCLLTHSTGLLGKRLLCTSLIFLNDVTMTIGSATKYAIWKTFPVTMSKRFPGLGIYTRRWGYPWTLCLLFIPRSNSSIVKTEYIPRAQPVDGKNRVLWKSIFGSKSVSYWTGTITKETHDLQEATIPGNEHPGMNPALSPYQTDWKM